jgi:arylsulfatase A-like enzyme
MVEMIDFYRTLVDLSGVTPAPGYVQGRSFANVIADPDQSGRPDVITQLTNGYSLRTPRYRFTKWAATEGLDIELYDRLSDPAEMVNLAGDPVYADVVARLLERWNERVHEVSTPVSGVVVFPPPPADNGFQRARLLAERPDPVVHAPFVESQR